MAKRSFVFSDEASARLERLEEITRLESGTAVVRLALLVFEDITNALQSGDELIIRRADGKEITYNPFLSRTHATAQRPAIAA